MGRDTFDAVLASVPQGATAGRVTSQSKDNWEPKQDIPAHIPHWREPPPMRSIARAPLTFDDLTGQRYGRLAVVGILNDENQGKWRGLRWVVRCACGDYEARSTKALKNIHAGVVLSDDRCFRCKQLVVIQNRYRKQGSRAIEDFMT